MLESNQHSHNGSIIDSLTTNIEQHPVGRIISLCSRIARVAVLASISNMKHSGFRPAKSRTALR
ncbi:hypothetical protein ACLB1R_06815 [Escherichia coli]